MPWKSALLKPYASYITKKINRDSLKAIEIQEKTLLKNIDFAKNTLFGKEHSFETIKSIAEYQAQVPLRSYPQLKPYVQQFLDGKPNVLWPGLPKYVVGTAGTTGGIKHIPLSNESMPFHLKTAIHAGMSYAYKKGIMDMFDGKLIFLTGTPKLNHSGKIPIGRLSGIVNHEIPSWLKRSQVPSYQTNCISDWNKKIEQIALETKDQDMRMISGIPPWIIMYLEKLLEISGKNTIIDLFPKLRMLIHGGVNYKPYEPILQKLIGKKIDYVETYPSTEGFIAFQNGDPEDGLLLNVNGGVFFEFVPVENNENDRLQRLTLKEVELNKNYAIIINNNAGLWGSMIGDTIKFVSLNPFRIIFTGRISQYLSAFGEHILATDVDAAILRTQEKTKTIVKEFTVAPLIEENLKCHHWLIEFEKAPKDMNDFRQTLDLEMQSQNFHYKDLIQGQVIAPLQISIVDSQHFTKFLKNKGKLGGQNKVPRIANNDVLLNEILAMT